MEINNDFELDSAAVHPAERKLPSQIERNKRRVAPRYLPTLFDRLCDDEPSSSEDTSDYFAPDRSALRTIIQRDLAYLLNTTNAEDLIDGGRYAEAVNSTINYGLPSLSGSYLTERKWEDIEKMIRTAIVRYEPRLLAHTLTIKPIQDQHTDRDNYNVLLFEISGKIYMEPYPIEFLLQTMLDLETNRLGIK